MRSRVGVAVLIAVVATLTTCCTNTREAAKARPAVSKPPVAKSAAIVPGRSTMVELSSGVRVEIPAGAVKGTGSLTVRPVDPKTLPVAPTGTVRVAQPIAIELHGATLTGRAKVVLPIGQARGSSTVQAAYEPSSSTWSAELGRYDATRHLLVTEVTHFSIRDWFRVDLSWAKSFAKKLLLGKFGEQLANVDPVTCPMQDSPATDGWKVASSTEPRITWCLDKTDDSRALRIRDGARYAVMIDGPGGLGYTRPVLPLSLASPFLKFEEALNNTSTRTYNIVRRGEDLTVDLSNLNGTAKLHIQPNMTAYLADLFDIEVDMVASVLSHITPAFLPKGLEKFKDPKVLLESAAAAKCMLGAFTASDLTLDAQRSSDPGSIAAKAAQCAIEGMKASVGIAGFLVSALISALSIPGNLVGTFIAGMSAATNPLDYAVIVTAPATPPVTEREMRNLLLPESVCSGLPGLGPGSHRLANGLYDAHPTGIEAHIDVGKVAIGDLDGDGHADGAMSLMCANGAADHFDFVWILLAKDRRQLTGDLTVAQPGLAPFDPRIEDLDDIDQLEIRDRQITVGMTWEFMGDPSCCPTSYATGTYRLDGNEFRRTGLDLVSDQTRTAAVVDAINDGDRARLASLLQEGFPQEYGNELIDQGVHATDQGCQLYSPGDPRMCIFYVEGGNPVDVKWDGIPPDTERRASLEEISE